jgi:hypothetical protein
MHRLLARGLALVYFLYSREPSLVIDLNNLCIVWIRKSTNTLHYNINQLKIERLRQVTIQGLCWKSFLGAVVKHTEVFSRLFLQNVLIIWVYHSYHRQSNSITKHKKIRCQNSAARCTEEVVLCFNKI